MTHIKTKEQRNEIHKNFFCFVTLADHKMDNRVRESAKFITDNADHVKLGNEDEFKKAAEVIAPLVRAWKPESWNDFPLHFTDFQNAEQKAAWVFLIDTMNYAFWTPEGQVPFTASYKGKSYTGYWSLCASLKRYIDTNREIIDPAFWARSTVDDWKKVFISDTETPCPFLEWRQQTISEAGRFLLEKYNGSVLEMIKDAKGSAVSLVEIVRSNLSSYRDQCEYKGRTVYILKRAQIFAADLHYAFLGDNCIDARHCVFNDIDKITMFADYRVPQALRYLNLLHYDDELENTLKTNPHLAPGSPLEVEIRGCSIQAVEELKKYIEGSTSVLIDFVVWPYAKEHAAEMAHIRIHQTSGIFY